MLTLLEEQEEPVVAEQAVHLDQINVELQEQETLVVVEEELELVLLDQVVMVEVE